MKLSFVLLSFLLWAAESQGAPRYHVEDFCYPQFCGARVVNNHGAVIGAISPGPVNLAPRGPSSFTPEREFGCSRRGSESTHTFRRSMRMVLWWAESPGGPAFAYLPRSGEYFILPGTEALTSTIEEILRGAGPCRS